MRTYEISYLISPGFSGEEIKESQEKISSSIQNEGGIIIEEKLPIRQKLGGPIKKSSEAYLAISTFQMNAEKLPVLEKKLRELTQILRYLILVKPFRREIFTERRRISSIKKTGETAKSRPKVEISEIEKKLEEILGR